MDFAALLRSERAQARQKLTSTLSSLEACHARCEGQPAAPSPPSVASLEACHKKHVDEKTKHLIFHLDSTPTFNSLQKKKKQITTSSPHVEGIRYYANFLTHEDARALHFAVHACKADRWVTLPTTGRRLQQWGGMPGMLKGTIQIDREGRRMGKGTKKKNKK